MERAVRFRGLGRVGGRTKAAPTYGERVSGTRGRRGSRATSGWVVERSPAYEMVMESAFIARCFDQNPRLLAASVVFRMKEELRARDLTTSRLDISRVP